MSHDIQSLIAETIASARARRPIPLIGLAGPQGSGKSFQCRKFVDVNPRVAHFSLDDVYWPKLKRRDLARFTHPLFITRGPPGTHDLELAKATIESLRGAAQHGSTPLPSFDKARDDRRLERPIFYGRPDAILIDGWCLGANAPGEGAPLNALEAADEDGAWRGAQVEFLRTSYADFFKCFDAIIYLQAPNWDIVRQWRGEQEVETLGRPPNPDEASRLDRFVQHFERVTRDMMAGNHRAGWIVRLGEARNVINIERRS